MAERRNIMHAIDDVVRRSPAYTIFQSEDLVALLEDSLGRDEVIRYALGGDDHKMRHVIFFLTNNRLVTVYQRNRHSWDIEDLLLSEIAGASLEAREPQSSSGGFWGFVENVANSMVKKGHLTLEDGTRLGVSTADKEGIERLFSMIQRGRFGDRPSRR